MTRSERNTIEQDEQGEPSLTGRFVPAFIHTFRPLKGTCAACTCPCEEHWEKLANGVLGHRGCTYALLQEVTRLRAELAGRS